MADPQFTVARSGGANAGTLNLSENILSAITRIGISAHSELGDEGLDVAFDKAFDALDEDNPSVSDLEDLADAVGVDISKYRDADGGAGSGGGAGDDAAAASANTVSLTANTRNVANAHGLPTDWHALDGIDLPPALASATLNDRRLAAAINRANGWDRDEGEGVTAHRVGHLRDKGGAGRPGASVEDLAGNDAGRDSDLDAEPPLPVSTVKQYVARHKRETGRAARQHTAESFGASIDDLD